MSVCGELRKLDESPSESSPKFKPLFRADWDDLCMVHMEIPAAKLQPSIPFELDLFEGRAFITLVFFTMRNMHWARGPAWLNWTFLPFREQHFLNVRTYVRCGGEAGIHFIAEWISSRVCTHLGPPLYALPYRYGKHRREFGRPGSRFKAGVTDYATGSQLSCELRLKEGHELEPCAAGTLGEFFFERYIAFNRHGQRAKSFRVWHSPWRQVRAEASVLEDSLLRKFFAWHADAEFAGAHFSPGAKDVLMGWPHSIQ